MRRSGKISLCLVVLSAGLATAAAGNAGAAGGGRTLVGNGSVVLSSLPGVAGSDGLANPETTPGREEESAPAGGGGGPEVEAPKARNAAVAGAGPEVSLTFAGLDHRDNRLANGGNQFSSEPPDQALCVGPNHVLEGVNTVMRVFDKSGQPAGDTVSFNEFFGYAPSIDRATGVFGAFITDPVCHFDADTGRYFLVVLTLDQDPTTGGFTGKNRLDIAVSDSDDPTGSWHRFQLPVQNDGTEGTPDHQCDVGTSDPDQTNPRACIGDYPHIGADRYGFFITTNEYSFFGDGSKGGAAYTGSQIYAISKRGLAAGGSLPPVVQFEQPRLGPFRSFTVIPAISPAGKASGDNKGTEFFLSSTLGDGSETGNLAPTEQRIGVWAVTNTKSLDSSAPNLALTNQLISASTYALPPPATQKDGPTPLRDCLNDRSDLIDVGVGCWGALLDTVPAAVEPLATLDSSDTRMGQVVYSNGRLWSTIGTAVRVDGDDHHGDSSTNRSGDEHHSSNVRAGVLWMSVSASVKKGRLSAETKKSGYLGVAGNNLTYAAVGVSPSGKVVLGMTVTGDDHYPSAGYAVISDGGHTVSKPVVRIIQEGAGPQDGFSAYGSLGGNPDSTSRWGDYGATAMDGDTLWLANESIEQTCTFDEFLADSSCGGTRTFLANWGTRVTALHL